MNEEPNNYQNNGENNSKKTLNTIIILLIVAAILVVLYRIIALVLAFHTCNQIVKDEDFIGEIKEVIESYEEPTLASSAKFAGFATELGALQDSMKQAMVTTRGEQAIRGFMVSEAQVYNYLARGGEEFGGITNDFSGDRKWLGSGDALEIPCTQINYEYAKKYLYLVEGITPKESGEKGQISYFVTPKGNVFRFPPYEYDGKCYVNRKATVTDINGNDITLKQALTNEEVRIIFDNGEALAISNRVDEKPPVFHSGDHLPGLTGVWHYAPDKFEGIDFSEYQW